MPSQYAGTLDELDRVVTALDTDGSGAVANDLTIARTSVHITGSNMSGKTTSIRAVGINPILAPTVRNISF